MEEDEIVAALDEQGLKGKIQFKVTVSDQGEGDLGVSYLGSCSGDLPDFETGGVIDESKLEIGPSKNITVKKDSRAVVISQTDYNSGMISGQVYIPLSEIPALIKFLQTQ